MAPTEEPARASAGRGRGRGRGKGRGAGAGAGGQRGAAASSSSSTNGAGGRRSAFGGRITTDGSEPAAPDARSSRSTNAKGKARDDGSLAPNHNSSPLSNAGESAVTAEQVAPMQASSTNGQGAAGAGDEEEEEEEEDLCWICAEPVKLYSLGPCNHRTCHICALRLRALYKVRECTFCKSSLDRLIFTASPDKNFEAFTGADLPHTDAKLSISFETREALQDTLILLRYNCPDERCDVAVGGWQDMKMHAKQDHHRLLCDLCIAHKKIFAHEHTLHTSHSLAAHMKEDHRFCEYCHTHFYSDDELFVHMRDKHEQCHICKATLGEAARWEYYRDYKMLEQHFRSAHFPCLQKDCLDQKFVVFASQMDLKAHQVEVHKADLSSRELQEAMRIEANFHYEDPAAVGSSSGRHAGGRKGRGGRRGGDGERERERESTTASDPLGLSSLALRANVPGAGPANHSRRIHFGGHTTTNSEATRQQAANEAAARAASGSAATVEERHGAFLAKVSQVVGGSEAKVQSFRSSVRAFRAGEMPAKDLVDNIYSLVGDVDAAASVVHGLVDLLEDEDRRRDVLAAWNKLRVERTHFPSLVPLPGAAGGDAVRSVKSRSSAANSDQIWANVERAATQRGGGTSGGGWGAVAGGMAARPRVNASNEQHFPSLGSASNFSSAPSKRSVPGSAAHSAASRGTKTASSTVGLKAKHGSTPWSTASSSTRVVPPAEPSPPIPYSSGSYPVSAATKAGDSSGRVAPRTTSTSAFPMLPTNASAAALAAHKRAVLSSSSSRAGSGRATPTTAAVWGSSGNAANGGGDGRIDSFPSPSYGSGLTSPPPLSRGASASSFDVNDLGARLSQTAMDTSGNRSNGGGGGGGGGGGKKNKKGVSMMSLGGLHRGN
ncbi:unnamed protein product [Parajaminaea phylloscopi]